MVVLCREKNGPAETLLTRQQAEQMYGIALKHKETDEYIDAMDRDSDSVKGIRSWMDEWKSP